MNEWIPEVGYLDVILFLQCFYNVAFHKRILASLIHRSPPLIISLYPYLPCNTTFIFVINSNKMATRVLLRRKKRLSSQQ